MDWTRSFHLGSLAAARLGSRRSPAFACPWGHANALRAPQAHPLASAIRGYSAGNDSSDEGQQFRARPDIFRQLLKLRLGARVGTLVAFSENHLVLLGMFKAGEFRHPHLVAMGF